MSKEEIIKQVKKLLFEDSIHLSRKDYREMLDEIGSDIDISLEALDAEDERNSKEE
jgi:hypothetical protein